MQNEKTLNLPLTLTLFYSLLGHGALFVALVLMGWIPLNPPKREITWTKATDLEFLQPKPLEEEKKKAGERRVLDPKNAQPTPRPTPKPTPLPTPKPVKKDVVHKPKPSPSPTPRSQKKVASADFKKEIATPTPEPTQTPRPTPKPKITPAPQKKKVAVSTPAPTPEKTPPPAKGVKDGAPPKPITPSNMIQTEEDISLPYDYLINSRSRIQKNFRLPPHIRDNNICTVEFKIRKDGYLYDFKIKESTGLRKLDQYAIQALQSTRYLPALPDNVNKEFIRGWLSFTFNR